MQTANSKRVYGSENLTAPEGIAERDGHRPPRTPARVVVRAAITVMAVLGMLGVATAVAHADGPVGTWACTLDDGVPLGEVSLTPAGYTFTDPKVLHPQAGRIAIEDSTVHFVDGPLTQMGITLATYFRNGHVPVPVDATNTTPQLILHFGLGQTVLCTLDVGSVAQ